MKLRESLRTQSRDVCVRRYPLKWLRAWTVEPDDQLGHCPFVPHLPTTS